MRDDVTAATDMTGDGTAGAALAAGIDTASKYLTFDIADRVFAVEVLQVREILDLQTITPLPDSPREVEGVVDVRGASVPIIDMSLTLGASSDPLGTDSRIIVFELSDTRGTVMTIGLVADRVRDVCQIEPVEIEAPPDFAGTGPGTGAVNGLSRLEDGLVVVIDLARIVAEMRFAL